MRFGAIAVRYDRRSRCRSRRTATPTGAGKSIVMRTRNAGAGNDASSLSPSRNDVRLAHDVARRGNGCSAMPTASIASTNSSALPSEAGISRTVDGDQRVRDAAAAQRREQVLDRRHAMLAQTEHGRAARVDDVIGMRRKLDRVVEAKAQPATGGRPAARARAPAGRCANRCPRTRSRCGALLDICRVQLLAGMVRVARERSSASTRS